MLADLANKINVCISKSDDYRITAAQHLAEAKRHCKAVGASFKGWVEKNIKFSVNEAYILARVGESADPPKALADLRAKTKTKVQRHRGETWLRNHTPAPRLVRPEEAALAAIERLDHPVKRNLIRSLYINLAIEERDQLYLMLDLFKKMKPKEQERFLLLAQSAQKISKTTTHREPNAHATNQVAARLADGADP